MLPPIQRRNDHTDAEAIHVQKRKRLQVHAACRSILKPLVRLLLQEGIAAGELADLCKAVYVESAAEKHRKKSGSFNQSRIAIVTGLTRAEVKRLLTSPASATARHEWHMHRASRVLLGWFHDPDFLDDRGSPKTLPVKGKQRSFRALVQRYSGDIPVRAMLDELKSSGAITGTKAGHVRVRKKTPTRTGLDARSISAIGDKVATYLTTLIQNATNEEKALFEATAFSTALDGAHLPILRRDIDVQGRSFIASVEDQLRLSARRARPKISGASRGRVGVAVFVFEDVTNDKSSAK